ncbi:MAG: ABC transporter ATP-binding protein [Anaerolineae bacterium]|nr:ABC transporter ATP-binding protein [Anaerolineae bacterium]MDW8101815.1 ABC transporter ATP-binding protein [Anaerolineae bacterium]
MTRWVVETVGLTKRYGELVAVDKLNLKVQEGEVFGLLGPNGSGKTTTILMLLGLTEPTSGSVRVLGFDPTRQPLSVKSRVGYLPELVGFYDDLTARENMIYIAKLNGLSRREAYKRIEQALEQVGLKDVADKPVAAFSRGMRQRLGLAEILIKNPSLIILDEPTQGLDPEGAREFLEMVKELKRRGITVLLSSHILSQVQKICDRVGLFHRGKMVLEGTVSELALKVLGYAYRIRLEAQGSPEAIIKALRSVPGVLEVYQPAPGIYEAKAEKDVRSETVRAILEAGGIFRGLAVEEPNLDEVYTGYFEKLEVEK